MADNEVIEQAMSNGIVFKAGSKEKKGKEKSSIKSKAKKKSYVTGLHGSGSAKKKADIRTKRAGRQK